MTAVTKHKAVMLCPVQQVLILLVCMVTFLLPVACKPACRPPTVSTVEPAMQSDRALESCLIEQHSHHLLYPSLYA